ncbi:Triacylglycerol lipase [Nesidiocoris tenuis]|uniref:Triacylglycerol lipase n=1 Tax=Nesidiocoris tenuis TaxID=355587 RepID=A0ABN7B8N4_9HEMI|nr:Triacylglycerol lipase [Nesidiocoris tenuis]
MALKWMVFCVLAAASAVEDPDNRKFGLPTWITGGVDERCYDELGCLQVTPSWYHALYRQWNYWPLPRILINVKFRLFTRKNPTLVQLMKWKEPATIAESNFDSARPTKFIVHGFIDTYNNKWVKSMTQKLLDIADHNVVVVDWSGGCLPPYVQATANTRLVGLELAYFINYLKNNTGLNPGDVHIIGHSLGSHIAGYAGERVTGLGRITALDPAGPYFHNMPSYVRLDPTDAQFVDAIHTDVAANVMMGYGMDDPVGHIDFYPNNGKNQPGCEALERPLALVDIVMTEGFEEAGRVMVSCNHNRAITLFLESLNGTCPYIGIRCPNYNDFKEGLCFDCGANGEDCQEMGINAQPTGLPPGEKYYLLTNKQTPYCLHHMKATVKLGSPSGGPQSVKGTLTMTLKSADGKALTTQFSKDEKFNHGETKTVLLSSPDDIGNPVAAEILWTAKTGQVLNLKNLEVDKVALDGEGNVLTRAKKAVSKNTFCPASSEGSVIAPNKKTEYVSSASCSL